MRLLCILPNEHILQRVAPLDKEAPKDEKQEKCSSIADIYNYDATTKGVLRRIGEGVERCHVGRNQAIVLISSAKSSID